MDSSRETTRRPNNGNLHAASFFPAVINRPAPGRTAPGVRPDGRDVAAGPDPGANQSTVYPVFVFRSSARCAVVPRRREYFRAGERPGGAPRVDCEAEAVSPRRTGLEVAGGGQKIGGAPPGSGRRRQGWKRQERTADRRLRAMSGTATSDTLSPGRCGPMQPERRILLRGSGPPGRFQPGHSRHPAGKQMFAILTPIDTVG
jgi:hypothetical protein